MIKRSPLPHLAGSAIGGIEFTVRAKPRMDGGSMEPDRRQREYSLEAAECERRAAETLDPIAARTYRDAARRWRELADRASQTKVPPL